jgi:transcriptional regulator with XRE-family HTH domain
MDELNKRIGGHIRKRRDALGLTREGLAEKADISDGFLYEIEIGKKGLSANKMVGIAGALGVTVDFLVSGRNGCTQGNCSRISDLLKDLNPNQIATLENIIAGIIAIKG